MLSIYLLSLWRNKNGDHYDELIEKIKSETHAFYMERKLLVARFEAGGSLTPEQEA